MVRIGHSLEAEAKVGIAARAAGRRSPRTDGGRLECDPLAPLGLTLIVSITSSERSPPVAARETADRSQAALARFAADFGQRAA